MACRTAAAHNVEQGEYMDDWLHFEYSPDATEHINEKPDTPDCGNTESHYDPAGNVLFAGNLPFSSGLCAVFPQMGVGEGAAAGARCHSVEHSMELLDHTDLTIDQLVELCGYRSEVHFYRHRWLNRTRKSASIFCSWQPGSAKDFSHKSWRIREE